MAGSLSDALPHALTRTAPLRGLALLGALVLASGTIGMGAATASPPGTDDDVGDLHARIEAIIEEHVGETTPGAMVAVVGPEGSLLSEAWGHADPVAGTALTVDSRTPVASVSKVVTSLTSLQLDHEGLLDLNADVRADLPVDDRRDPAAQDPVTGWHLLTHHAGIDEPMLLHPDPDATVDPVPLGPPLEEHPPVIGGPTGVGLQYSPIQGYQLLGAAIEDANGTSFEEATRQRVLEPAGTEHADFGGPSDAEGDVRLSTREGEGWAHTSWAGMPMGPSTSLTWSTRDATALLQSLLAADGLSPEVVEEATTTTVRPAHGGGGHTGVFFESWREDVRVLEQPGADGLAYLALMPEAELGVFAAVTTEDPAAADLTEAILDEVANWAVDTGRTAPDPMSAGGMPTIAPSWTADTEPVVPVGTFQEQLFAERGPELLWRTMTGQATVRSEGEDLLFRDRRLVPTDTPGRWCDDQGCIAGAQMSDGSVVLLRSDVAMLQQTLVPAHWWADQRFVSAAMAGALLLAVSALAGAVRARWRRRHDREVPAAVARGVALAWSGVTLALIAGTVALPLAALTGNTSTHIASEGVAVWALRIGTAAQLGLGGTWLVMCARRWSRRIGRWRRILAIPVVLIGLAMSTVLVTWALPSV